MIIYKKCLSVCGPFETNIVNIYILKYIFGFVHYQRKVWILFQWISNLFPDGRINIFHCLKHAKCLPRKYRKNNPILKIGFKWEQLYLRVVWYWSKPICKCTSWGNIGHLRNQTFFSVLYRRTCKTLSWNTGQMFFVSSFAQAFHPTRFPL